MKLTLNDYLEAQSNGSGYCKSCDKLTGVLVPVDSDNEVCTHCGSDDTVLSLLKADEKGLIELTPSELGG
jgi:hypothetical protein